MKERFLHFIWQYRYFSAERLFTSGGEEVNILFPGYYNTDSGPDFSEAIIIIGGMKWYGSLEIHVNSSDWIKHRHQEDEAYDNVVLHVVWADDSPVRRRDGTLLPTIELQGRVDQSLYEKYEDLLCSLSQVPCCNSLLSVDLLTRISMTGNVVTERLKRKAQEVQLVLQDSRGDWEQTLYKVMAGNFGFKLNNHAFERLAEKLPFRILQKHASNVFQLEALIFGQAGLLERKFKDEYPRKLRAEYDFLSHKYNLKESILSSSEWKFMRMRPANFPTLRMAQLAAIINKTPALFSHIIEARNEKDVELLFRVKFSSYWEQHYYFDKPSQRKITGIGDGSIFNILVNTIAPLLVCYSQEKGDDRYIERAVSLLEKTPAENNRIIKLWRELQISVSNAFESQAYIELFNNYCKKKRCLDCKIGTALLKP